MKFGDVRLAFDRLHSGTFVAGAAALSAAVGTCATRRIPRTLVPPPPPPRLSCRDNPTAPSDDPSPSNRPAPSSHRRLPGANALGRLAHARHPHRKDSVGTLPARQRPHAPCKSGNCRSGPLTQCRLNPNPPMRSGLGVGTRGEGRGTRRSALDSDKWGRWRPLVVVRGVDGGLGQRRWGGVGGTACRGRQSRTGPVRLCGSVG